MISPISTWTIKTISQDAVTEIKSIFKTAIMLAGGYGRLFLNMTLEQLMTANILFRHSDLIEILSIDDQVRKSKKREDWYD